MTDTLTSASGQVTGEPLEWWERLGSWRVRRWQTFRRRYPGLARVLGWARWALLAVGLVWLLVVAIWFENVRIGLGAYVGALWILICCVVAARTRTLSWGESPRVS